jgi:hypothetical protein
LLLARRFNGAIGDLRKEDLGIVSFCTVPSRSHLLKTGSHDAVDPLIGGKSDAMFMLPKSYSTHNPVTQPVSAIEGLCQLTNVATEFEWMRWRLKSDTMRLCIDRAKSMEKVLQAMCREFYRIEFFEANGSTG